MLCPSEDTLIRLRELNGLINLERSSELILLSNLLVTWSLSYGKICH